MILSDGDIRRRLEAGDLVIEPLDDPDLQIQPASVDLRLGSQFVEFSTRKVTTIHPDRESEVENYFRKIELNSSSRSKDIPLEYFDATSESSYAEEDEYIIHPDEFVLGTTLERVEIPRDLIAHVQGRSSLGRMAIVVHATAGIVDPGYRGQITLELSNLGRAPVALRPGMRISQLIFTRLSSPAERPYGSKRGSKYQDQEGPLPSKIQSDQEFGGNQQ